MAAPAAGGGNSIKEKAKGAIEMEALWMVVILLAAVVSAHLLAVHRKLELGFPLEIQEPERLREQVEVLAETCVAAAERGYLEGCIGLEEVRAVARIQLEEMLRRLYDGRLTETEGLGEMIDEILEPGERV